MGKQITGILFSVAALLAFISVIVLLSNPFKTIPSISVENALWVLGKEGIILYMNVSTSAPVQLLGVDVGGHYHEVAYDIYPPSTIVRVPVEKQADEVRLHFSIGTPKVIRPSNSLPEKSTLSVVFSNNKVVLYGSLVNSVTAIAIPVPDETRVLVVVAPGKRLLTKRYIDTALPDFNGDIVNADDINMTFLEGYTTIVFTDIAPSPELLRKLVELGKTIVLHTWSNPLGQLRLVIDDNSSVIIEEYPPEKSDIDFFGAHCVVECKDDAKETSVEFIKRIMEYYGYSEVNYAVLASGYCSRQFSDIYMTTADGDIVVGRTTKNFFFASIKLHYTLLLSMSGFFEGISEDVVIKELTPFRGVRPIILNTKHDNYLVTLISKEKTHTFFTRRYPVSYAITGNKATVSLGIDDNRKVVWRGSASLRIEEYTYDMDLIDVKQSVETVLPGNIAIEVDPFHTYLIYVNNTPVSMIVDDQILYDKPRVSVEFSTLCEIFFLSVKRSDTISSPLVVYVNGRKVAVLNSVKDTYETHECNPGYYEVVIKDVYGNILGRHRFSVSHIYESPLFIVAVLSGSSVAITFYVAMKRRTEKEVEEIRLVLYRLPDAEEKTITPYLVASTINNLISSKKMAPRVAEVLDYIYRKHPTLKAVSDTVSSLAELLSGRAKIPDVTYTLYSRYVPEVDDTISIIARSDMDAKKEFYTHVIVEVLKRLGGVGERESIQDIMEVDLVAVLGDKMLLITYAPSREHVRDAINRGLTTFIKTRKIRLPFSLVGIAVITENEYVESINKIIDDILRHNEEVASKFIKNMTVFTQIRSVPRDMWLRNYIIVAVPITRIAPLFAFTKSGAVRICNKYYRFTTFIAG